MQAGFRRAENKDIDAIVKLVDSAYRGDYSRQGWSSEADLLDGRRTCSEEVSGIISAEQNVIILLEKETRLLASLHVKKLNGRDKANLSRAYLGMFAVDPASQNAGIGKAIMSYAEKFVMEKWQCCEIEMSVIRQRLELITWYEKLGYQVSGESRAFPYGDERYGIPKREDLVLDVLLKRL